MPSWPISLGKPCNIKPEAPVDTLLRSETDVGPAKLRKRFTAASRFFGCSLYFTGQQRIEFESFFNDEIARGAEPFDWEAIDPHDDSDRSVRIQVTNEELLAGSPAVPDRTFKVDLRVEILP